MNHTAICQPLRKTDEALCNLWDKRAYAHWLVGEGMEEGMIEADKAKVVEIIQEYENA